MRFQNSEVESIKQILDAGAPASSCAPRYGNVSSSSKLETIGGWSPVVILKINRIDI